MQTADKKEHQSTVSSGAKSKADAGAAKSRSTAGQPWYAGQHKDALLYLMIAIFFVELVVGGVAFFYGVMHAAPEVPGGPPLARFPWLVWALAAILAPVGLILIVHLAGTWVSHFLGREARDADGVGGAASAASSDADQVPERLQRFYAIIRNAPTVVVLLGILLLGVALFFVDGAFTALVGLGQSLTPYIPWIAGSVAAMIAICYLVHRLFVYRHHRMQQEFAYRREVLERTGIVLVDKNYIPLPQSEEHRLALGEARVVDAQAALPPVVDADAQATPSAPNADGPSMSGPGTNGANASGAGASGGAAADEEEITDAVIITPERPANRPEDDTAAGKN
ncbi:hypothetical protein [Desulfovibrio intestinalis]|uniref:Membrane protein YdbS with pleckstrin-like domain n=1 Tax=Desulfovibrio intestinalis TaxID=58621 RepID=A0A7W8FGK8_9BACT|nr:hypothetical protein [Desulfovibrio intestinalis]MBB5144036.1 membrane protein YdbS with pleckstrin-like domain [Desulfovibrio intestinalis]